MKSPLLLSLALSVLAANAFAQPVSQQPIANAAVHQQQLIVEGGSDHVLKQDRFAEGGSDRTLQNRVAQDGSDHVLQNRVAEGGSDRLPQNQV